MMMMIKHRGSKSEERICENGARSGGEEEEGSKNDRRDALPVYESSRQKPGSSCPSSAVQKGQDAFSLTCGGAWFQGQGKSFIHRRGFEEKYLRGCPLN